MKKILEKILYIATRLILKRHKPKIIAVVGSVGKTSAKEAIYTVVSSAFKARKATGSYNNEIGVPLTIIGAKAQGKNLVGWLCVMAKFTMILLGVIKYPEVLVLEFGEEFPGDIEYLMKLTKPDIVVVTKIANVHTEFFKSIEGVAKEIGTAIRFLKPNGKAIVNFDDQLIVDQLDPIKTAVISVGANNTDISVENLRVVDVEGIMGLSMRILYKGTSVPVFLPHVPAKHQAYAVMQACGVGLALGMNLVGIGKALLSYRPPNGRTTLIDGIHKSLLIDDTYNASPIAARAALSIFSDLPERKDGKKMAVFGDMLELGEYMEEGHKSVGKLSHDVGLDVLVTCGDLSKRISDTAVSSGMDKENVHHFPSQEDAAAFVESIVKENDVVLIKGSQGSRMENITKALMVNPDDASRLLVRQSKKWLRAL